jgi:hypothetical protein
MKFVGRLIVDVVLLIYLFILTSEKNLFKFKV